MTEHCTIYLVRHAEKQQLAGDRDPPLTTQGQRRAEALAERLAGAGIRQLYATDYRRTRLTLQPLATRLGLPIQRYDAGQSGSFLRQLLAGSCPDGSLIAGHSNTLPDLLRAAGIAETAVEFDESRYGELFIIERRRPAETWQTTLRIESFGD